MSSNQNQNNNQNNYRSRNRQIFKSSTDINNYNKFLLELDAKNQSTEPHFMEFKKQMGMGMETKTGIKKQTPRQFFDPNIYQENLEITQNQDIDYNFNLHIDLQPISHQEKQKVYINQHIGDISDLLKLIDSYPDDKTIEYNIDIHCLHKIKEPLTELNSMIGMKNIKENIVDQILFYIQKLHLVDIETANVNATKKVSNDFMHTVIYGSPGTGKTEIAKIMGSIFAKMGVLSKGTFKKVTRSDLIAGYLGQTAIKTKDAIKESLGGVLFIDEAYSLGNTEKKDTFSKECIDTLCEALSDNKDNLMVIIAGYEADLNDCFFNYNQGLHSRFTWRFKIDDYTASDLYNIFLKKINDSGWSLSSDKLIDVKWFEKNKSSFPFYGRDIETLFAKTKIAHSRRVFCLDASVKKQLTLEDINKGLEIYLNNNKSKEKKEEENIKKMISYMYM